MEMIDLPIIYRQPIDNDVGFLYEERQKITPKLILMEIKGISILFEN